MAQTRDNHPKASLRRQRRHRWGVIVTGRDLLTELWLRTTVDDEVLWY